jgi:hypothetical protein
MLELGPLRQLLDDSVQDRGLDRLAPADLGKGVVRRRLHGSQVRPGSAPHVEFSRERVRIDPELELLAPCSFEPPARRSQIHARDTQSNHRLANPLLEHGHAPIERTLLEAFADSCNLGPEFVTSQLASHGHHLKSISRVNAASSLSSLMPTTLGQLDGVVSSATDFRSSRRSLASLGFDKGALRKIT